jgi:hypothetical protein
MADQNARLLVYLKKIGEKPAGYRLAHIHISELPGPKKTRDNITRAIQTINQLKARHGEGEIFLMRNLDLVFVAREIGKPIIAAACDTVEKVFVGNQGVQFNNIHGGQNSFYTIFDLAIDFPKVLAWAESVAGVSEAVSTASSDAKKPADFATLMRVQEDMLKADITPMLFNQPVYLIGEGGKGTVVFQEIYISVQALENTLCPGYSLTARPWLFSDLTEDLDAAVLKVLSDPAERVARRRMSINLNLSTLSSQKFVKFDADLPPEQRQDVVLEISKTDIFENMRLYRKLTPFLRERGYRVLLDGLTMESALAIDFDGIDCDFAKVFWAAEAANYTPEQFARIKAKLARKKPRIVLARCDTAESARFAKSVGISLVQGRLIDHMVKKNIPL